ncbi:GntR family transcriptional regulator [Gemmatimonas aurantiaca]|uniref:GntR family transcriptional regulator n=1 Tax=Gemmatimonas aurantiaca TaxID=173480 RepID=UPI00301C5B7D
MLPFHVQLRPGDTPLRQVVFAATKAILAGVLREGDAFPSVREISEALRIHPNTAQKIVAELVRDGFLTVQPGIGTTVNRPPVASRSSRGHVLEELLEASVVEARRQGWEMSELLAAVEAQWVAAFGADDANAHGKVHARPGRGK